MPNFSSVFAWSFSVCFLGWLLKTKPVLGEVRRVCFQAWCVWVVLLTFLVVFSSRGLEILISNCVYYYILSGFGVYFFLPQVKLWTHLLFKGRASVLETKEYCRLYSAFLMCFWTVFFFFFATTWKLKRDIWLGYILYINLCINGSLFSWATV